MTFTRKYFDGAVPPRGELTDADAAQLALMGELPGRAADLMDGYRFKDALTEIMAAARGSNRYFDHRQPWVLRKEDPAECGTVLNVCLNTIKILGAVMAPFLPIAAEKVAGMLSAGPEEMVWDAAADPLPEGRALGEPAILFEKIEEPEEE